MDKFMVLKCHDIWRFGLEKRAEFLEACVRESREMNGESIDNRYAVINLDETYANEVIEIMRRHGHWGNE